VKIRLKAHLHRIRLRRSVASRRSRYRGAGLTFGTTTLGDRRLEEALEAFGRDGYVHLRGVFDPAGLRTVSDELTRALDAGHVRPFFRSLPEPGLGPFLSPEEEARGEDYIKSRSHVAYVRDPFVHCRGALRYVFSNEVIDFAAGTFGCPPCLVAGKVVRSYLTPPLPPCTFHGFHADDQAARIVKFLLYLHEVDEGSGPFCYVAGSHRGRRPRGWRARPTVSEQAIAGFYGEDAVRVLCGRPGDLIVADTVGFHRAIKPRERERRMLLISTGVHRWPGPPVRLREDDLRGLSAKQRAMADLAELV